MGEIHDLVNNRGRYQRKKGNQDIIAMKRNKYMRIVTGVLLAVSLLTSGCGGVYEGDKDGYTKVTSVEGVSFDMPEHFLSQSTTLSEIEKDGEYATGTFLYKDGESEYILFNIDEAVIAVERDTKYNLREAEDIRTQIKNASVSGIWMTEIKDKITYKTSNRDGQYKVLADVLGNVSITPELYGKYTGYFASVQYGDYECSIFAGVRVAEGEKMTNEQEEILSHIVKSFQIVDADKTNECMQIDTQAKE